MTRVNRKKTPPPAPQQPEEGSYQGPYAKSFEKRRKDILNTAWRMIAEHGGDQFKLEDLSKRCGVALRTIYNAFSNKDGVVAQALAAHYNSLFGELDPGGDDAALPLVEAVRMSRRIADEVINVRAFSATAARMYFGAKPDAPQVEALRNMPVSLVRAWMRSGEVDTRRVRSIGKERIERSFANLQWGAVQDWALGRISDDKMRDEFQSHVVMTALAFGNRAGRRAAMEIAAINGAD
ncbi:MAG TPA: TetR/AcrR family transcriptional regulator [Sphingomonadales bacterium]